jgi:hypothetical protein
VPAVLLGLCAVLSCSFSHVLGIDGDLLNITAAKELKAQGELCFRPVGVTATAAVPAGPQQQQQQAQSPAKQQEQPVCVVRVPDEIDRDRVRWVLAVQLQDKTTPNVCDSGMQLATPASTMHTRCTNCRPPAK